MKKKKPKHEHVPELAMKTLPGHAGELSGKMAGIDDLDSEEHLKTEEC